MGGEILAPCHLRAFIRTQAIAHRLLLVQPGGLSDKDRHGLMA
jgi:hypothetical protein